MDWLFEIYIKVLWKLIMNCSLWYPQNKQVLINVISFKIKVWVSALCINLKSCGLFLDCEHHGIIFSSQNMETLIDHKFSAIFFKTM